MDILEYYSRPDIQQAIATIAQDRELVGATREGAYLKRPDVVLYPRDVLEKAKKGAVAFHCSVEHWSSPLAITNSNQNELRKGWDLIIDIDSKSKLEHGKIIAGVVINFLKDYSINPTIKFSGRRGFHIAVADKAFPKEVDFQSTAKRYPDIPRAVCAFLKEKISDAALEALTSFEGGMAALTKDLKVENLSPYNFVEIEQNWGSRHLFRAPYSLHDKTWLVSKPIRLFKLNAFQPELASPAKAKVDAPFLESKELEATELLTDSLDWAARNMKKEIVQQRPKRLSSIKTPIPEQNFPPCIRLIVAGLGDGKKRSLFTLVNFLRSVNWTDEQIENFVAEVNKRNQPPLPGRMVTSHLRYHSRKQGVMPPNCDNKFYYDDFGICKPDQLCALKKIKNPVNYAFKSMIKASKNNKNVANKSVRKQ